MRRLVASIALVLVGCATRDACPAGDLSVRSIAPALALVRSDYASSAVALLAADGTVLQPDFVDSGTRVSSLVTAVAGDVVVPSTSLGAGAVAWMGRLNNDVLTIARDGTTTQIDARGERVGAPHTGFSANPQDAVLVSEGRILISRLGINPDASAPELQRGNDVVVVDGGELTERLVMPDGVLDGCTEGDCVAHALPAVLVPLRAGAAQVVLVVLERLGGRALDRAGPGAIVAIDATSLAVSAPLSLAPLENCQYASIDPSNGARAYVSCTGLRALTPDQRRPSAGIAEIALDATGELMLTGMARASASDLVVGGSVIALGARRVLAIATESTTADPSRSDHVVEIDVAMGTTRDVARSVSGFQLGIGVLSGNIALVPDAEASTILRFDLGDDVTLRDSIPIDDCLDLPPRQIGSLSR